MIDKKVLELILSEENKYLAKIDEFTNIDVQTKKLVKAGVTQFAEELIANMYLFQLNNVEE